MGTRTVCWISVLNVVLYLFAGSAPERPPWLRRLVQGLWVIVALAFLVVCVGGAVYLVNAL